jgi:MYXO-CTERM domain-containing protein
VDPTPLLAGTSPTGVSMRLQVDGTEVGVVPLDLSGTVVTPGELEVGCGCESASGAGLGAVALLLGAWALRSRRPKS